MIGCIDGQRPRIKPGSRYLRAASISETDSILLEALDIDRDSGCRWETHMKTTLRLLEGSWNKGVALDKHSLRSTYLGDDEHGRPQFDTERTEVGEALFQLKYRSDWNKVAPLANAVVQAGLPAIGRVNLVVPMPASHTRARQPVLEIARQIAQLTRLPCNETMLTKAATTQLKNLTTREEKEAVLANAFSVHDGG